MTIPTMKNLKKKVYRQCILLAALLVLAVFFLVSHSSSSKADDGHDTQTSGQLLNNRGFEANVNTASPSNWTVNGEVYVCNTCGPYGGNALITKGEKDGGTGGLVSQTVDLFGEMTQAQVNHGFDLNYKSQVWSYSSNSTVPSCSETTGNCRDTFEINVTITDSVGIFSNVFIK